LAIDLLSFNFHPIHQHMLSIQLHNLQFFAYHGLYETEKLNGNNFEVNVDIDTAIDEKVVSLSQTVDYVAIYEIIYKRMQTATPLLETLAQDLADNIHLADNRIKKITVSVKKISAPIQNFTGTVGVSFTKAF
jgi:7,8-dihydroneopterin aldolase/epimerase/oxygenase